MGRKQIGYEKDGRPIYAEEPERILKEAVKRSKTRFRLQPTYELQMIEHYINFFHQNKITVAVALTKIRDGLEHGFPESDLSEANVPYLSYGMMV